jgi:OmpA-OmpF porin, OOP family
MSTSPRIRRRTLVASVLGLAALTACTGDGGDGSNGSSGASDGEGGAAAASDGGGAETSAATLFPDAVATATMPWGQSELTVGVRPIVRHQERLVLTLDLHLEGPDEDVPDDLAENAAWAWRSTNVPDGLANEMRGVRLVDLEGDMIASPALDVEREIVKILTEPADDGTDARRRGSIQLGYGDLGTDTVALFLPGAGLLSDLTVDDADVPTVENTDRALDLLTIDEAPVTPMITRAFDLLAPLREKNDGEASTVSMGSDVLFDSSSAELTGEAAQVLDVAATRITAHEPGEVIIEGHTDDVGEDAPNQELSQARAEAVAAALAERIDTAQYPVTTVGKGETEPLAENDSEDGRAQNRRVELMISTPMRDEAGGEATRAPFDGLGATGEEGLELENFDGRPYLLRAPSARLVSGHLVVALEATVEDDVIDDGGLGGLSDVPGHVLDSYHDEFDLLFSYGGLGVLTGSLLTLPVLHRLVEDEASLLHPLANLYTNHRVDGGATVPYELVYPRGLTGVEPGGTIALQMNDEIRLTDIPVSD